MPVDNRQIWTPRNTIAHFRAWPHKPSVKQTKAMNTLPPKRTPLTLDASTSSDLLERAAEWRSEADTLEKGNQDEEDDLRTQLCKLMFSMDVPKTIKNHEREWDPKGDGSITKGEFRLHIRALNLRSGEVLPEVDSIFEEWDTDNSGTIDMLELEVALKKLRSDWVRLCRANQLTAVTVEKIAILRRRAGAAEDAAAAAHSSAQCEIELAELRTKNDARLELKLASLFAKRGIKPADVVASWPKPRVRVPIPGGNGRTQPPEHVNELALCEFKDEIMKLGLQVDNRLVTGESGGA